jgi:4'-phosphopantetheinyl transferase
MKTAKIEIFIQPLAQFITQKKQDFENFAIFNQYKKDCIYTHRNQLLSAQLKQKIESSDFAQTEYGKPYLPAFEHVYFNHSHSQKNYALALSHQMKDLGVDLEDLDRKIRFEALAQHAFHPNELERWQELEQDKEYWFKVWTTKEAVLKASGLGIRMNLNELDTQVDALNNGGVCQHPLIGIFAYQNYTLPKCMLTVAWRSDLSCKGFALPRIELITTQP